MNFLYLLRSQHVNEEATILLMTSTHFRSSLQQTVRLPRTSTGLAQVYTILHENEQECLIIQWLAVFKVSILNSETVYTVSCDKKNCRITGISVYVVYVK
jgi:hypothetical protein